MARYKFYRIEIDVITDLNNSTVHVSIYHNTAKNVHLKYYSYQDLVTKYDQNAKIVNDDNTTQRTYVCVEYA